MNKTKKKKKKKVGDGIPICPFHLFAHNRYEIHSLFFTSFTFFYAFHVLIRCISFRCVWVGNILGFKPTNYYIFHPRIVFEISICCSSWSIFFGSFSDISVFKLLTRARRGSKLLFYFFDISKLIWSNLKSKFTLSGISPWTEELSVPHFWLEFLMAWLNVCRYLTR